MDICVVFNALVFLLGQGPIVALLVNGLKKIRFVKERPLLVAALLNLLVALATGTTFCGHDLARLLEQILAGFAGSVATYEVAKHLSGKPRAEEGVSQDYPRWPGD